MTESTEVRSSTIQAIETSAPIKMDLLRLAFKDKGVTYVIDTDPAVTRFRGATLLTYLSNLDVKIRLQLKDPAVALELTAAYLKMPKPSPQVDLDDIVMAILLHDVGITGYLAIDAEEFIWENRQIIDVWHTRLRQLPLYARYIAISTGTKSHVETEHGTEEVMSMERMYEERVKSYPEDPNVSLVGVNYVHLIRHPLFALYMETVTEEQWTYSELLFNSYCFAGNNLFYYFAIPENPLFIATLVDTPEKFQQFVQAAEKDNENFEKCLLQLSQSSGENGHVPRIG